MTTINQRYFNLTVEDMDAPWITKLAGSKSTMMVPLDVDEDGRLDIIV